MRKISLHNRQSIFVMLILALSATVGLAQTSRSARTYLGRANDRFAKGELAGAIADYSVAIAFEPSYAEAYLNRGNTRLAKGDLDGAVGDFDKAVEINPQ